MTSSSSRRHRSSSVTSERSRRGNKYSKNTSTSTPSTASSSRLPIHREGTSAKTTHMHDDSDAGRVIPTVQPAFAIDYLGSGWNNEDDIAASWKFMTKQKNDLINGLRLENASWRNWAKQRHNLKTVNPRTLNWLKDCDTTWLYGPLYKANIDEFDLARFGAQTIPGGTKIPKSSSPTKKLGGLKPALKHKTASELFKADTLFHVQSDLKLDRKIEPNSKAQESLVIKQHRQPKLRFNDSVEQCVSVDTEALSDDEMANDTSTNDEEEDDTGILMKISSKHPQRSILRIHPTRLKAENMHGMDIEIDPILLNPQSISNSNSNSNAFNDAHSTTTTTSPSTPSPSYSPTADSRLCDSGPPEIDGNQAGKGGFGQKAVDIVNNVRDIVHWASSLVYNSSAF
ncbi:hypothetical protein BX616_005058 [Lobosporangium transversale]|uniref:Nitrogen regulatory protein areA GATA-like domain-containing protein n=1 Tax=Lobosporangium transversale TaxID=64571 RepID=A0A1Y2H4B4_9FUNG|nr:hypothetical protein BCR41DRAFT_383338 [Lobosporangium transversale]KAF9897746.1 hypothetical protein BX616_005058 [Lobosporangium transversale]ORZ28553.1 hypothetical protein BCR41DRAFT_383338 [Lobosporangium transversale]|eukprot:XP_021886238.1 hypothetical protein BCR41DRAFT_383338 [Lobosporangium transversale]